MTGLLSAALIFASVGAAADAGAPARAEPAFAAFDRTRELGRISPHLPLYIVYGPQSPEAKYQLSFKYRLFSAPGSGDVRAVYFGYTQRALWDIGVPSTPFFDTSYMPELFWASLSPSESYTPGGGAHWLGYHAGVQHESNGKDGGASRSINTAYARPIVMFGDFGGWNLVFAPKIFAYFGSLEDNPLIADYRGYVEWAAVFGKKDGLSVSVFGRTGRRFNRGGMEVGVTHPVRIPVVDFASFAMLQWFEGYGESMLSYDRRSSAIRIGLAFVR